MIATRDQAAPTTEILCYGNRPTPSPNRPVPKNIYNISIRMPAGRPPKDPSDRRTTGMRLPLTEAEKALIDDAAEADEMKPVTWARDAVLKAATKRLKNR